MSKIAKLKKQAAEFEQKRQFDKALAKYRQVLDEIEGDLSEADVALYNRVGDLLLRQGSVSDAVTHYERAVDLYADGGYFSNAIALCNKILRTAPGRSSVYYKLGRISARKGFVSDAKQNFLEYADRMRKQGQLDEAFRALKEFADLCPDQDDIRIMLADQLARDGRRDEAIDQLQLLYEKANGEGRATEAKAVLDKMRTINPSVVPSNGATPPSSLAARDGGLPLSDAPRPARSTPAYTPRGMSNLVNLGGLPLIHPDGDEPESEPVEGIERAEDIGEADRESSTPVAGLETAFFEADPAEDDVSPLADLEHTVLEPGANDDEEIELLSVSLAGSELDEDPDDTPVDLPFLTPVEDLTSVHSGDTPEDSEAMPEIVPQESEPLELTPQDSTLVFAADDESPFGDASYDDPDVPGDDEAWDAESATEAAPAVATMATPDDGGELEARIARLRRRLEASPGDAELHREFGEVLIESGARDEGMEQLEAAIWEFERIEDYARGYAVANEILRMDPDAVRFHQKRVEFAFRTGEKGRLVDAYLGLADSLVRGGEIAKARVVYQRVIDLSPDDARARVALDTISDPARPATPPSPVPQAEPPRPAAPAHGARPVTPQKTAVVPPAGAVRPSPRITPVSTEFIDLASLLDVEERPRSTRMIAEGVSEPADDAQVDFAEMLERFKQGVAANVDEGDFQSHYDLGIAYREMGLIDEAIAEFQKALRAADDRVKTYEALGQCFIEKEHYPVAITLLSRALTDGRHGDDTLIGVLYMLGSACEAVGRHAEARSYYERVYAVDIGFRDVNDRLAAVGAQ